MCSLYFILNYIISYWLISKCIQEIVALKWYSPNLFPQFPSYTLNDNHFALNQVSNFQLLFEWFNSIVTLPSW